jgi:cell wall-associated NlpC family hydrolase
MLVAALALSLHGTVDSAAYAAPSTGDIQKKIDKASDDLEDVVESYNKMREDLKATKAAEKDLAASLQPAREQLATASAEVSDIAVSAYKTGQVGAVNAVLEGPGDLMTRLGMLEQLTRTRQRQIDAYTQTTQQFESRQTALHNTQVKQTAQVKELAARKDKIEGDLKKLYAMRKAAFGSATEKGTRYTGAIPSVSGSAGTAVSFAFRTIGLPYSYGAAGPGSYDCSGLTSAAWRSAGRSLPHNAAAQWGVVSHISRSELKPGDLVFYRALKHVGIYVGNGKIIDASRAGQPVKHRDMDVMPPYGYGRVT